MLGFRRGAAGLQARKMPQIRRLWNAIAPAIEVSGLSFQSRIPAGDRGRGRQAATDGTEMLSRDETMCSASASMIGEDCLFHDRTIPISHIGRRGKPHQQQQRYV